MLRSWQKPAANQSVHIAPGPVAEPTSGGLAAAETTTSPSSAPHARSSIHPQQIKLKCARRPLPTDRHRAGDPAGCHAAGARGNLTKSAAPRRRRSRARSAASRRPASKPAPHRRGRRRPRQGHAGGAARPALAGKSAAIGGRAGAAAGQEARRDRRRRRHRRPRGMKIRRAPPIVVNRCRGGPRRAQAAKQQGYGRPRAARYRKQLGARRLQARPRPVHRPWARRRGALAARRGPRAAATRAAKKKPLPAKHPPAGGGLHARERKAAQTIYPKATHLAAWPASSWREKCAVCTLPCIGGGEEVRRKRDARAPRMPAARRAARPCRARGPMKAACAHGLGASPGRRRCSRAGAAASTSRASSPIEPETLRPCRKKRGRAKSRGAQARRARIKYRAPRHHQARKSNR